MLWIFISLGAYFLRAITNVVDKKLLTSSITHPFVYGLGASIILTIAAIIIAPFVNLFVPATLAVGLLYFASGASFIYGLIIFFWALSEGKATTIIPLASLSAIFTLIFSALFFGNILTSIQLIAFVLLIGGGYFISQQSNQAKPTKDQKTLLDRITTRGIGLTVIATIFFGVSYTIQGQLYAHNPFWGSFVIIHIAGLVGTITLLLFPSLRKAFTKAWRVTTKKAKTMFSLNQLMGVAAFLLISFAFSLVNPALVDALEGAQYVFLFIITIILSYYWPHVFHETFDSELIFAKSTGIIFILAGVVVLALFG